MRGTARPALRPGYSMVDWAVPWTDPAARPQHAHGGGRAVARGPGPGHRRLARLSAASFTTSYQFNPVSGKKKSVVPRRVAPVNDPRLAPSTTGELDMTDDQKADMMSFIKEDGKAHFLFMFDIRTDQDIIRHVGVDGKPVPETR